MDLTTSYLGLTLKNPLVASSCSLTGTPDGARKIEAAGCAALVIRSLFEEHIFPSGDMTEHLTNLEAIRKAVEIPVMASINCRAHNRWASFARKIEDTGVHAIELNVYDIPEDPKVSSADIESRQIELVHDVAHSTRLPVSVKLAPYYTALIPFCHHLEAAGVKGLVLFNRFMQPDINTETGHMRFNVNFSRSEDLRLPLRWTAILRNQLKTDIAISGGVHTANDAIQSILVGANAVCLASALYQRHEVHPVTTILNGLKHWLAHKGHVNLDEFRGSMSTRILGEKTGFERAHYVKTLSNGV